MESLKNESRVDWYTGHAYAVLYFITTVTSMYYCMGNQLQISQKLLIPNTEYILLQYIPV